MLDARSPAALTALVLAALLMLAGCAHMGPAKSTVVGTGTRAQTTTADFPASTITSSENESAALAPPSGADPIAFSARAESASDPHPTHCPFGNPGRRRDIDFGPTEVVWRKGYDLLHSADLKTPYWVCERYTRRSLVSNHDRGGLAFKADPQLKLARAVKGDYKGSSKYKLGSAVTPMDIGHMAPAEAHSDTQDNITDTFYFSNAVPQNASMNRGAWASIENCARLTARSTGYTWVISGPMQYAETSGSNAGVNLIGNGVVVPSHVWKIVVSERPSDALLVWAVIVPNENLGEGYELDDFASSIDAIEDATGFDFMPELPASQERSMERASHSIVCQ